ncbi:MAG TPA: class II glutamine amidotransferase, partial [Pseudomonadales bacterium]|nr:class II glutamine amidotransferase [Pseudomonadales bacterium]
MCQLFGMNSRQPASVQFSLEGFMRRGGDTDHHSDGWGIAFVEEQACRIITDALPSVVSPLAEKLRREVIKSRNVIAHVRKATHGPVTQSNCHPFQRQLWGRNWVFAHNGRLDNFQPLLSGGFLPAGDTDSEQAFCLILQELREYFGAQAPSLPALHEKLLALATGIAQYGPFNFLLSEGKHLFAYCSTELSVLQRQAPFGRAQLVDCAASIDFAIHNHVEDRMALVATRPLTHNENWQSFFEGELKLFVDG